MRWAFSGERRSVLGSTSRPGISILLRLRVIRIGVPPCGGGKRRGVCRRAGPGTAGAIDEPQVPAVSQER
ncbi:hypothetical protein Van01_49270 [Micromonospora andamanensis]|uniref:Uncharacterized protein n=1 Tax=Micromonospora andamanensis TaxID=1287068 RepID=A0ABQ4I1A4_9ACTN|nr:hypothetical protein Van01_49270 [Micromonospora andamanensis]GIJ40159.1 hypothetical protein Vwe01_34840 [Micromonospora andamanensis]